MAKIVDDLDVLLESTATRPHTGSISGPTNPIEPTFATLQLPIVNMRLDTSQFMDNDDYPR